MTKVFTSPPLKVLAELGEDGQPQWAIFVATPLTTQAVASLCKTITNHGGIIRSIAFVATATNLSSEASAIAALSPQLQLKVQGPTLATELLHEKLNDLF